MILDEVLAEDVLWQMSFAERAAILGIILDMPSRNLAVEVGSYQGGFLRILSKYFSKVYSLDIDHSNLDKDLYTNVEWVKGDSKETLMNLVEFTRDFTKEPVDLILIDGDHEYDTVKSDISNVLKLSPQETVILIHDSWYEPSRKAILEANWAGNPYIHHVEVDFCTGDLMPNGIFIGGLALVRMSSQKRQHDLVIGCSHEYMYKKLTGY